MKQVEACTRKADDARVDGVVSFGGGSAIDTAKMLAVRLADRAAHAVRGLPHVAVPTTLSAAELAAGAGYTDDAGNKAAMPDPRLLPAPPIYHPHLPPPPPLPLCLPPRTPSPAPPY